MTVETPLINVTMLVAISENGQALCCIDNRNHVQRRDEAEAFMQSLRDSKELWVLRRVKVTMPLPVSYEEIE